MNVISRFFSELVSEDRARGIDAGKLDKLSAWNPLAMSAVEDMRELTRIRGKSRDLYQNNDLAHSLINKRVNAAIGHGITPQAATSVEAFNELVDRQFDTWAMRCSPMAGLTFYGIQNQSTLGRGTSGEAFVLRIEPPPDAKMKVPLRLKVLEADMLDHGKNVEQTADGGRIVQGVECDKWERVTHYWFHHNHPGDTFGWARKTSETHLRWPQKDVAHVWDVYNSRPSQVRGLPWLTSVVKKIKALDKYESAEQLKQEIAACFGLVVEGAEESTAYKSKGASGRLCDANGVPIDAIFPGMTAYAPEGATIKTVQPSSVLGVPEYMSDKKHGISAALGVPYAMATGDLSKVNFSSSRYGQGTFLRLVGAEVWLCIIPTLCDRVWQWWTEAAYDAGVIQTPVVPVEWTTQQFPSVNPLQDAQAEYRRLRMGTANLTMIMAEQGNNWRRVLRQRAKENAFLDGEEITLDSDPRYRTQAGTTQPVYDTEETQPSKKKAKGKAA